MCLALPAKVLAVDGDAATVSLGGVKKQISLALVEGVVPGDYVIVHTGFALSILDPAQAERTLALFREADRSTAEAS
jgi:hydrogenase expression/formation protein HypC